MEVTGVRRTRLYRCIQDLYVDGYPIAVICSFLKINRSSYYKWIHRRKSVQESENETLLHEISVIYEEHSGTYGYRRIADEYNATHDKAYNLKRFYRLTRLLGLRSVIRRKRPSYRRSSPEVTAANILNRSFTVLTAQHLPVRRSRSPHLRHVLPVPGPLRQGLMRRRRRIGGNVDSMERNQARGIRIMLHKERRRSTFIKKTCINKVRIGKNALPLRPKSKKSV